MKSLRIFTCAIFSLFLALQCGLENPYLTSADSGIRIVSKSFSDGDTISIFLSESLTLELHLKEYIDHITLHTPANRLWSSSDTVIVDTQFDQGPFTFRFSFYDTGWQEISITAQRITGDSVVEKFRVYAGSPLAQTAISGRVGDTVLLFTPQVSDDAQYVWDFRDGTVIRNNTNHASFILKMPLTSSVGDLYVSDHAFRSPSVLFTIVNKGAPGLTISSLNDSLSGDTIYTGDDNFTLRVGVTGATSILTATINGVPFERASLDSSGMFILTTVFSGQGVRSDPMQAMVAITDGKGSTAERMFWIQYTHAVPRSDRPVLQVIFPSHDSVTAETRSFTIRGSVNNRAGFDSLFVFLRVGDSLHSDDRRIGTDSVWQWTFDLVPGWNPIVVMAFEDTSRQGDTLAVIRHAVKYVPGAPDTIPPQLITLRGNGMPLRNGLITSDTQLVVTAEILDNGTIASIFINDIPATVDSTGSWFSVNLTLTHRLAGTAVNLRAIDSAGNRLDTTVTVYLDQTPFFTRIPLTARIPADSFYSTHIGVSDPDGDSVSLAVVIQYARGDSLLLLGGARLLVWRPVTADTGWHTIKVHAWDGYKAVDTSFIVYVSPAFATSVPVRFMTKPADIPHSLVADKDSLRLTLRVDPVSGTPPIRFSARVVGGPILIDKSDSPVVFWTPVAGDTGIRTLECVVSDSLGTHDTISGLIAIVPAPNIIVSFEKTGSGGSESVSPVIIHLRLWGPAHNTITATYAVDWTKTTADSTDFGLPVNRTLVFNPGDTAGDILVAIVNDTIIEYDEKIALTLISTSPGAVIGARSTYGYTIIDDDKTSISFVDSVSSATESISERTITVQLSRPVDKTITVGYLVDNASSAEPADYRLDISRVLTFAPGQTSRNIPVTVIDDAQIESDETLLLTLKNPSSLAVLDKISTHSCRIIDNDTPNHVYVYFSSSNSSGPESVAHPRIPVQLSAPSTVPITVTCTVDKTSTAVTPGDYAPLANSVITFPPGTTDTVVVLSIANDNTIENDETVVVSLSNPSAFASLGTSTTHTYTIKDDDAPPIVLVEFAAPTSSAPESSPAVASVRLSAPSTVTITVAYAVETFSSTAKPTDYQLSANRTLTFQPGDTVKTISVPIVNDTFSETNEQLVLKLISPSAYASLGGRSVHTHTIVNDDFTLQVSVSPAGSGTVVRTVNGAANNGPYTAGTSVDVTANPATGYLIASWRGPVIATADPGVVKVRMDSSASVIATFKIAPPVITVQPSSQTVLPGSTATFSVTATGSGLSYRWQKNGADISGAISSSYTTPAVSATDNRAIFRCIAGNSAGSDTSSAVTLTVSIQTPVITRQPHDTTIDENRTAIFSLAATGTGLTYQWQKNDTTISAATAPSYTTPAVTIADSGALFQCMITNAGGAVTSSSAVLSVRRVPPTIISQPSSQTINEGDSATFSVLANGTQPLSYQWFRNDTLIAGATSNRYRITEVVVSFDSVRFHCLVTNAAGSTTSLNAMLTVNPPAGVPKISKDPWPDTALAGGTARFTVKATGGKNMTYQWQVVIAGSAANIAGATGSTYTISPVLLTQNGERYQCVVTNPAGSVPSSSRLLVHCVEWTE